MDIIRFILHYGMHFLLPFLVAFLFFRMHFWSVSIILLLAILIDLDHLFANPIFNPNRCSIGFHPLHSYEAIAVYFAMLIPKKTRIVAIGLIIHIFGDMIDCILL